MRSKSDRINPDSLPVLWFTVGLVAFLAVSSFMVSFTGLREVAAWAGLPEWLRWAVPVFVDVAILAYTLSVLIHRHRGESTWPSWVSLGGFTVFSVVANAAHAMAIEHRDPVQSAVGIAAAAAAPIAVFTATEQLARLIVTARRAEPDDGELVLDEIAQPTSWGSVAERPAIEAARPVSGASDPVGAADETGQLDEGEGQAVVGAAAASGERASGNEDRLGREPFEAWVVEELGAGRAPTGKSAGEFLGVSERTGRNRLNDLRRASPELFEPVALGRA